MNKRPYHEILSSAAADALSRNTNLWPNISARLERKPLIMKLRTHSLALILLVLFILLLLSGVVYAVGRSLGYIPGIGLVDQNAPLRVLAAPVSQTYDGITVTAKEAVLSSDKTIVVISFENNSVNEVSRETADCKVDAEIHLPGEDPLQATNGRGEVLGSRQEYNLIYAPIPSDMNSTTLLVKCVLYEDGIPRDYRQTWELPLKFIPAPPDMTALPVTEYEPSQKPETTSETKTNPITLSKVIDADTSYILIGKFAIPRTSTDYPVDRSFRLLDGNGKTLPWNIPSDVVLPPSSSPDSEDWVVEVDKGFVPPLTIHYSFNASYPTLTDAPLEFEFDAGENPQSGDIWQLNQEFNAGGHRFTLKTIKIATESLLFSKNLPLLEDAVNIKGQNLFEGYDFSFSGLDETISGVQVDISGYTSIGYLSGVQGSSRGFNDFFLGFSALPKGNLTISLSVELSEQEKWSLEWQP